MIHEKPIDIRPLLRAALWAAAKHLAQGNEESPVVGLCRLLDDRRPREPTEITHLGEPKLEKYLPCEGFCRRLALSLVWYIEHSRSFKEKQRLSTFCRRPDGSDVALGIMIEQIHMAAVITPMRYRTGQQAEINLRKCSHAVDEVSGWVVNIGISSLQMAYGRLSLQRRRYNFERPASHSLTAHALVPHHCRQILT